MTSLVSKLHSASPVSASRAYTLLSSAPTYATPSATVGALTTQPPAAWRQSSASSSMGGPEGPVPPGNASSGIQLRRPRPNPKAAVTASGEASGRVLATMPATSAFASNSARQPSVSSVSPPICATKTERNTPAAVPGSRQPKSSTSDRSVSPSEITRRSSTDGSSSPSASLMQDCSEVVSASNKVPHRVSASMSRSGTAGPPTCSGVGVAGRGVGVGVGVGAGVGSGAAVGVGGTGGVAVGPSPHAESKAAASKQSNPTHAIRRTDAPNTPSTLTSETNTRCLPLA